MIALGSDSNPLTQGPLPREELESFDRETLGVLGAQRPRCNICKRKSIRLEIWSLVFGALGLERRRVA